MILTYLLVGAGTALGLWAVAALVQVGHLFEAVFLLGLVLIAGWASAVFAKHAPRWTGLAFVGLSLSLSLEVGGHMAGGLPPGDLWAWVFFLLVLALGPFFLDLATRFPVAQPKLRWLVWLAWGLTGAIAVLGPLGWLGPEFDPLHPLAQVSRELRLEGHAHTSGGNGGLLVAGALQLVGLWVLGTAHQRAPVGEAPRVARQAVIMILGAVLSWLPTVAYIPGVLPPGLEVMLHGPPALTFSLVPLSGVVALRRPDLYDGGGIFRRVLIGLGLVLGGFLTYLAVIKYANMALGQIQPGAGREPVLFAAALVVALTVRPLHGWITAQVDQIFFPHLLGFRSLLQEVSGALATTIIPDEVARLATSTLPARLGTSGAVLLVLDDMDANLASQTGVPFTLTPEDPLWDQVHRATGPTMLRDASLCSALGLPAPALMLPLRVGGRLVGVYVLGARESGVEYAREELGQLMVLGHHMAVAVENGRALRKIDALSQRALAEVEERNQIAREIHDTIAQGLTAASLQLDVVKATLTTNPARAERATDRAQAIVRDNLAEARRSVLELRAPLLGTESLPAALGRLLNQAAGDIGAAGTFRLDGTYRGLPARVENQLYRITQEALHNAVKYSSARHLTVELHLGESQVTISVMDDGAGFDTSLPARGGERGGFGLTGMGERARLLGGELRVVSEPGEGTLVEVTVPVGVREGGEL
jgi:signal transduction histidine kinase